MLKPLLLLLAALLTLPAHPQTPHTFTVDGTRFLYDNQPTQIISGELHYARIPREYWRARLKMARAMGLNTIATYVFWNIHEPTPGHFDFSGQNDLAAFIRIAGEEHLHVLLRAGPYACAEWEFGGFPAWLLKDPKMSTALRANDPAFLVPAQRFISRLAQETAPLLAANGGPIIAVQVENEYGNFGSDTTYLQAILKIFQSTAFSKSLLYTVDPSKALARGQLPGIISGVNFGTGRAAPALDALATLRPNQPLFATEYWPGWFDLFGYPHQTRPLAPQLADLETIFSRGASVNIYMVHGGTSFGTMAGASQSTGSYRGNVTSYDYDAPIDEAGHPTPKFFAYRDLILKYTHEKPLPIPDVPPVIAIPTFTLTTSTPLWDHLPQPITSPTPLTMEQLDQAYGYILYRRQLEAPLHDAILKLDTMQDFATVYLDGVLLGTLDRHKHQTSLKLNAPGAPCLASETWVPPSPQAKTCTRLDILVESTGRLNSTKWMRLERKGMQAASLNGTPLLNWQIYPLPMDPPPIPGMEESGNTRGVIPSGGERSDPQPRNPRISASEASPHFATGTFPLTTLGDAYLDISTLGKGLIWINGHPLGRFWNIGPQQTLYVPAPWLKQGQNEVTIFAMLPGKSSTLTGRLNPILDGPTPPEATKADDEFAPTLTPP